MFFGYFVKNQAIFYDINLIIIPLIDDSFELIAEVVAVFAVEGVAVGNPWFVAEIDDDSVKLEYGCLPPTSINAV